VRFFRSLALAGAVSSFLVALLGSWVRVNNAGLTCPDWPLCNGAIVPALRGGVVLEWSHRAGAYLVSLVVVATLVAGWRLRSRIRGLVPALGTLAALLVAQVLLGGATVLLGNSPISVMLHWGTGMALFATFVVLTIQALTAPANGPARFDAAAAQLLALAAVIAFVTMCIGSYVGSSYAGLACPAFPQCDGTLLGHTDAQRLQMLHRIAAALLALAAIASVAAAWIGSPRVRRFALIGLTLVGVQVALGAVNVAFALPLLLREAHAANAALVFIAYVIAATLALLEPFPSLARASNAPVRNEPAAATR
jgi:heme A synthase